jgi:2-(1,2-epoxy-1,2-dihydrophenyl)acetyl-CoA isomerase
MPLLQDLNEVGVLTLTLNRPEALNALTKELLSELGEALKDAQNPKVRCLVLTGAGRAFCAGQDLKDIYPGGPADARGFSFKKHLEHYIPVLERLTGLEKPVLAAINGAAAGAGFSLALACDMRVASEKASFVTAFSRIGLVPDSGMSYTLPRLVGHAKALELMMLSPKLSAEEARALGLVNYVAPEERFKDEVWSLATRLAEGPTKAYGLIKRLLLRSAGGTFGEALNYEADLQDLAGHGEDHLEGIAAFLEKRAPRYRGT